MTQSGIDPLVIEKTANKLLIEKLLIQSEENKQLRQRLKQVSAERKRYKVLWNQEKTKNSELAKEFHVRICLYICLHILQLYVVPCGYRIKIC